tara:strand:- start:25358 stop:25750 length:393 start_codon:yes stop_codon:yes gene_type:complete
MTASHAAVVTQIEETISILVSTLELDGDANIDSSTNPVVDEATFCIIWQDHTCYLGNTLLFWLFHRLAQSSNQYIAHVDLLEDVWHGERQSSSIRGVAKRLRDELIAADMEQLATAIDGRVYGHYGLMLI